LFSYALLQNDSFKLELGRSFHHKKANIKTSKRLLVIQLVRGEKKKSFKKKLNKKAKVQI